MTASLHRTTRDVITVSGPDAATYLQGQLSQDIAALDVGASAPTFALAPQGKVDGWGRVHRAGVEVFVIDSDPGSGPAWDARLHRFLLRTKATIELVADVPMVAIRGAVVQGGLDPRWPGLTGGDLLGDAVDALAAPGDLAAMHDLAEIDDDAYAALRISSGVPAWGHEIDADTIPASLGAWVIESSVSFTKGCYTGQELVARMDSRGNNAPTRLAGVLLPEGSPVPAAGATLATPDGAPAGTVTSAAPLGPRAVALAFVPRAIDVPSVVTIGGLTAELVALPFGGAEPG